MQQPFNTRRWATVMLQAALQGDLPQEMAERHISQLRQNLGASGLEEALQVVLLEATRQGAGHRCGELYRREQGDE